MGSVVHPPRPGVGDFPTLYGKPSPVLSAPPSGPSPRYEGRRELEGFVTEA